MQKLQDTWDRVPIHMRGGGPEALCELLVNKIPKSCYMYVQIVRAMIYSKGEVMDDYQAIAKVLLDLHNYVSTLLAKGMTEANLACNEEEAEAQFTQGGGKGSGGKSSSSSYGKKPAGKMLCHRCGKTGHFKKECTQTCTVCGLQQCGGVKTPSK